MGLQSQYIWHQSCINVMAILGFCTSAYALYVELKSDEDEQYKPLCDLHEKISCSKAFMSKWGRGYGIIGPILGENHPVNLRNPIPGMMFYVLIITLAFFQNIVCAKALKLLVIISNFASIYLALILYFGVESLCVVCVTIYVINFVLLLLSGIQGNRSYTACYPNMLSDEV
uniref:vitamin-K-epoxide reductase (warfarin-sensitive) n=1 Tax=Romanomermis culicivorax TaxID=13658 RepID=A0A915I9U4_ROMCU